MMEKMKQICKWAVIVLCVGLLVVGVPLVINECHKIGGSYITQWEAKDVLAYYGTIIAAFGAMIGVFLTIRYSHMQYRENLRLSKKPLFSIDVLRRNTILPYADMNKGKDNSCAGENDLEYQECRFDKVFFVVEDNTITLSPKLSGAYERYRQNGGFDIEEKTSGEVYRHCACYIPHEIKNVGAGCAINVVVALFKMKSDKNAICTPISVNVGESLYVGILFKPDDGIIGRYDLKLSYYDVLGNRYVQDKFIEVRENIKGYTLNEDNKTIQRFVDGEAVVIC